MRIEKVSTGYLLVMDRLAVGYKVNPYWDSIDFQKEKEETKTFYFFTILKLCFCLVSY